MNKVTADYLLSGYLLDKNLDSFVREITRHYAVNDSVSLPKHYEEALLLYTHLHSTPYIIYKNDVLNADFQDYQKLENTISMHNAKLPCVTRMAIRIGIIICMSDRIWCDVCVG